MDKWLYRISLALAMIGLLVSVYMTIYKITSNDALCLGSGDCSTVNASRYSEVYGVPVAAVGIVGYLAILLTLWWEGKHPFFVRNAPLLVFGMALTGFLFTVYLIYVEFALLKAICPFCLASQIAMTFLFLISLVRLARQPS
ncbi:MAG: hypothetical protein Fur0043_16830 [Anaerolineales bacterium]